MIFGWSEVQFQAGDRSRDAEPVCLRLDSVVRHSISDGHRRHQLSAGRADGVRQHAGDGRQLADQEAREGLLRAVPAARNRHARRVLRARFLPVLRVLGSHAAADVLPDRHLGRPAQGIRGDQVLPVHAVRQRADADRHPDAVLQQRLCASCRPTRLVATGVVSPQLDEAARQADDAEDLAADNARSTRSTSWPCSRWASTPICSPTPMLVGPFAAMVGVRAAVHRLRHQGAQRAAAHVVARCARRSADADLDDPGRRAAEDGRLRHHPHLLPDLSRRPATTWRTSCAASASSAWSTVRSPRWPKPISSGWSPTAR